MRYSPKTTILSLVLLAGAAGAAQAQSVANLPPAGGVATSVPQSASTAPQIAAPNPGSNIGIPASQAYQKPADWDANRAYHPYSTSGAGPNPGSNVAANNEPNRMPPDAPATDPYSNRAMGTGPSPGR
jgi:hypothetical protein